MKKLWGLTIIIFFVWVGVAVGSGINGSGGGLPACSNADYTTGTATNCAGTPANAKVELDKKLPITSSIEMTSDTTGPKYAVCTGDPIVCTWENGSYATTPVIGDPDNFAANFTGANLYGGTFIANAAGTAALPDPAAGMNFTIVLEGANAVVIDPLGTGTADTIVMNGLAAAADENITSSTSGAMCVFQYRAANSWMATCKNFVEATPP